MSLSTPYPLLALARLAGAPPPHRLAKRDLSKGYVAMIVVFCVLGAAVVLAMIWRLVLVSPRSAERLTAVAAMAAHTREPPRRGEPSAGLLGRAVYGGGCSITEEDQGSQ